MSSILHRTGVLLRDKQLAVWNYILAHETTNGTTFLVTKPDGKLYIVLGLTHQILAVPKHGRGGERLHAYFNQLYGLGENEAISKWSYDALRHHITTHGTHVELRRFSAYRPETHTSYLSTYDGHMWKITGSDSEQITRLQCGEDEIFFADDDGGVPLLRDIDIGPHDQLFDRLTALNFTAGLGGATPRQQQMTLIIWMIALAIPDLLPTKPLMLLEGTEGSGKSSCLQLIQYTLQGSVKPLIVSKSQENDFGVLVLRSPIAVLDNLDSYIDWIPDKVCAYTTLGIFPRRKLFTDDEEVVLRPHSFLAVASKNPASFRREDVADRCLIMRLERRKGFRRFEILRREIIADRPRLLGEYLWIIGRVIDEIRAGAYDEDREETHRMADFAALGRVVARVMGWTVAEIDELMLAISAERNAFINEEDPLVELLHKWVVYSVRGRGNSIGREITIHVLFSELESIAQANGIQSFYKSTRVLAQKIRSPFVAKDFDVEQISRDGHKTYKIWRKGDTKLSIVEPSSLLDSG